MLSPTNVVMSISGRMACIMTNMEPLFSSPTVIIKPTPPKRRLPRSSGSLVHSLAQCPVLPHLAHLERLIRNLRDHFLGLAVFRALPLPFPLPPKPLPFPCGGFPGVKKPLPSCLLCRYLRTCP